MILLDTNVLSEVLKLTPAPQCSTGLTQILRTLLFRALRFSNLVPDWHCSVTTAERQPSKRYRPDDQALGTRVYAFDAVAAQCAAQLLAQARAQGLALHQLPNKPADLQIARIAAAYGLDLATRNVEDFRGLGLTLIDPWLT
jgi:toxin FitB